MTTETALTAPLSETETRDVIDRFYRDGYALVPGVLGPHECSELRRLTDEVTKRRSFFVVYESQDEDIAFARLFIREPILSLVQKILGPECRFCAENVIRNAPGQAISHWHVDDKVEYPLPPDLPRWDARVRLPVTWLSVQIPLTDIISIEDGPTEVVTGSQYSGRVSPKENPVFEGRGAEPIFCRAGDIYLFNHQMWHRGSPNTGQRTRYLMQLQYVRGDSLAWRCQGSERTPALKKILEGADPKLVEIMLGPPKQGA